MNYHDKRDADNADMPTSEFTGPGTWEICIWILYAYNDRYRNNVRKGLPTKRTWSNREWLQKWRYLALRNSNEIVLF